MEQNTFSQFWQMIFNTLDVVVENLSNVVRWASTPFSELLNLFPNASDWFKAFLRGVINVFGGNTTILSFMFGGLLIFYIVLTIGKYFKELIL